MTLRRCRHEMLREILEETCGLRKFAATRLAQRCGLHFHVVKEMIEAGLLEEIEIRRKRWVVTATERGRLLLQALREAEALMPKEENSQHH